MNGSVVVFVGLAVLIAGVALWVARARPKVLEPPPYIKALGALADGDGDTAYHEFRAAVRTDSSNVDAYLRLGDLLRARGDPERAYQLHRELAARPGLPRNVRSRVLQALCRDHLALERSQRAVEAGRQAVSLAEDPTPALATLLEATERAGDLEEAFQVKKEILRRKGRQKSGSAELAAYRAAQGRALLERGELKEAERVLKDARKLDPGSRAARYVWGALRERLGDYAAAIESWQGLLKERPEDAETLFLDLERAHFLNGSFGEMERTYNGFLDSVPGHEGATFGLARFLRRKGQIDDALDVCRRGLDAHPGSRNLRVLRLALLLQSARAGEAEALLNDWLAENLSEASSGLLSSDQGGASSLTRSAR